MRKRVNSPWREYKRSNIAEMRPYILGEDTTKISVSNADIDKVHLGGYVARNPDNHEDVWFVAADYFKKNFERLPFQIGDLYEIDSSRMEVIDVTDGVVTLAGLDSEVDRFQMSFVEMLERGYQGKLID